MRQWLELVRWRVPEGDIVRREGEIELKITFAIKNPTAFPLFLNYCSVDVDKAFIKSELFGNSLIAPRGKQAFKFKITLTGPKFERYRCGAHLMGIFVHVKYYDASNVFRPQDFTVHANLGEGRTPTFDVYGEKDSFAALALTSSISSTVAWSRGSSL